MPNKGMYESQKSKNGNYPKRCNAYLKKWRREHRGKNPWYGSYLSAQSRCNTDSNVSSKYYKQKGIKFCLSMEEFEFLWGRDNASRMDHPHIDRIDPNGNYELSNCQFLEASENSKKAWEQKGKQRMKGKRGHSIRANKLITIPAFDSEREYIQRKAHSLGISLSEYIRKKSIPNNYHKELEILRKKQGNLPRTAGRPKNWKKIPNGEKIQETKKADTAKI